MEKDFLVFPDLKTIKNIVYSFCWEEQLPVQTYVGGFQS